MLHGIGNKIGFASIYRAKMNDVSDYKKETGKNLTRVLMEKFPEKIYFDDGSFTGDPPDRFEIRTGDPGDYHKSSEIDPILEQFMKDSNIRFRKIY